MRSWRIQHVMSEKYNPLTSFHWSFFIYHQGKVTQYVDFSHDSTHNDKVSSNGFRVEANVIILRKLQFCTSVEQDLCCCIFIFFALKTLTFYKDFLWNRILLSRLDWETLFFWFVFLLARNLQDGLLFWRLTQSCILRTIIFILSYHNFLSLVRFDGHIHCNTLCKQITESLYIFF